MAFLNPLWLLALPLVLLPIVIHLLNQRRHRTVNWGAMQFLVSARRMSRGMARLKQVLIMAARMLVVAGLILAVCRPLSSGWVGTLAGGKPETVIVLLDRSASMQQQQLETSESKLSGGVRRIVDALQTVGVAGQSILIESCSNKPVPLENPKSLLDLPETTATDAQADLATLMQTALDFVADNQTGRTDIWICSDAARNDWNPDSSRWSSLRSGFSRLDGVRFHVLNFPEPVTENFGVVVDRVERVGAKEKSELVLDLTLQRTSQNVATATVPVTLTINGLRSVLNVSIEGTTARVAGHRIPVDAELRTGWGAVELPADSSPGDNAWYFAFADPPVRRTVIVSTDPATVRAIDLAAATAVQNGIGFVSQVIAPDRVAEIDWQQTALVVWQAEMPDEPVARQLNSFVESGRTVLFLPPAKSTGQKFGDVGWGGWVQAEEAGQAVGFWNNDSGLLSRTRDGQALPVNDLLVYRYCELQGEVQVLARLENGQPLLAQRVSNAGAIYYLATLPVATHSSMDREGITLFAMVHRALATGADSLGAARQFDAGSLPALAVATMPVVAGGAGPAAKSGDSPLVLAGSKPFRSGVYGDTAQMIALNRPRAEGAASPLPRDEIGALFAGLDCQIIEQQLGRGRSLASEIWRAFLVLVGIALVAEAVLCLPEKTVQPASTRQKPLRAAA